MRHLRTTVLLIMTTACNLSGCHPDYTEVVAGDYHFVHEGPTDRVIATLRSGDDYVPCKVEHYVTDGRFILARQLVTATCFWEGLEPNPHAELAGEIRFWIIDTSEHRVLGPLTASEFHAERARFQVPTSLELPMERAR